MAPPAWAPEVLTRPLPGGRVSRTTGSVAVTGAYYPDEITQRLLSEIPDEGAVRGGHAVGAGSLRAASALPAAFTAGSGYDRRHGGAWGRKRARTFSDGEGESVRVAGLGGQRLFAQGP